jgi:hypothetical protein
MHYILLTGRSLFSSGYLSRSVASVPDVLSGTDEGSAVRIAETETSTSAGEHLTIAQPSAH